LFSQSREAHRRKSHLVCAGGHDPVAIVANTHALTGFLEIEILQQLHAIGKLWVIFQTPKETLARAVALIAIMRTFFVGELAILATDGLRCR
jgi:hypothetical protein